VRGLGLGPLWAMDGNELTLSHFSARVRGAMRSMILLTHLAIDMAGLDRHYYEVCSIQVGSWACKQGTVPYSTILLRGVEMPVVKGLVKRGAIPSVVCSRERPPHCPAKTIHSTKLNVNCKSDLRSRVIAIPSFLVSSLVLPRTALCPLL